MSTYNRKQRNLTCSDVLRPREEQKAEFWGLRNRQKERGMKDEGDIDEEDEEQREESV